MKRALTLSDLVLHAASLCQRCQQGERPELAYTQEQGFEAWHPTQEGSRVKCKADQIWQLIARME